MKNTNENTMEKAQAITAAVMNDLRASGAKVSTKEEMYEAACKYVQMTKEQFATLYNEVKASRASAELSENELDTVVGGTIFDWVDENLGIVGLIVTGTLLTAAVVATGGAALGGIGAMAGLTGTTVLGGIGTGAAAGAITGAAFSIVTDAILVGCRCASPVESAQ